MPYQTTWVLSVSQALTPVIRTGNSINLRAFTHFSIILCTIIIQLNSINYEFCVRRSLPLQETRGGLEIRPRCPLIP